MVEPPLRPVLFLIGVMLTGACSSGDGEGSGGTAGNGASAGNAAGASAAGSASSGGSADGTSGTSNGVGGSANAGGSNVGGSSSGAGGSVGGMGSVCLTPALGSAIGGEPSFEASVGPELKVDLDISGRASAEVTENGYQAWAVEEGASISKSFGGIGFRFEKSGSNGAQLTSAWNKALVQDPNDSRLAGDGLTVEGGDAGAEIKLTIEKLAAGHHSLLVFLNEVAEATGSYAPVDVLLGGKVVARATPKARAASLYDASTAYVPFDVKAGESVVITFRADASSSAKRKNVFINGFELDTPDASKQAKKPSPLHADEHVDADSGSVKATWQGGEGAVTHDFYLAEKLEDIEAADRSSPAFRGSLTGTSVELGCLSKRKTYYWRVDEIDAEGKGTRGDLWYFRPRQLAFPSAEGYGRFARGGRDGQVIHVTNLNDSGAGSLREAVEKTGPRVIVFDVGGLITLKSRLTLGGNYAYVAGQTAPGKGITIRSAPFGFSGAVDSIMRFVRVRLGYGITYDGMGMQGSNHCIFDHNSISWTIDEAFSSRNGRNISLQRTLISEALNVADHQNYPAGTAHGYAGTISGRTGSFHHNLLAHCEGRNFSMGSAIDGSNTFASKLDLFNNVVYNFGGRANDGQVYQANFVGNYYKKGPATKIDFTFSMDLENYGIGTLQAYYAGNILQNANGSFACDGTKNNCGRRYTLTNGNPEPTWEIFPTSGPFFPSYATIHSAKDAYKTVLSDVGVNQPVFDDHDVRVVKETLEGKTTYKGSKSGIAGLPDRESDVGGYESYPETRRDASWDTDGDGLPNFWEMARGLDPQSPAGNLTDTWTDADGDDYTELDDYLEWLASPHYVTDKGKNVSIDLGKLFAGYSESPAFTLGGKDAAKVTLNGGSAVVSAAECGFVSFSVEVKDSAKAGMSRSFGVFVACP